MEEERTVLCVANQKGGCGKTTIAYHLARLAAQGGKSVLAVDMDPQGNLTELFTEGELKAENHTRSIFDEKSPVPLTVVDGIRLIGSDITLSAYEKRASWHDIGLLRLYLSDRPEKLVIVDCPPNLGLMTSSALFCATRLLVPVTMGRSSVKGLRDLFATAKDLRDMGKDVLVEPLGIVLNAMAEGQLRAREARELLWQGYSALMLKTIIPQAASVEMAMNHKKAVWRSSHEGKRARRFTTCTPKSRGGCCGQATSNLCDQIGTEEVQGGLPLERGDYHAHQDRGGKGAHDRERVNGGGGAGGVGTATGA